uniref:Retrovirus-related Pol polyprotein from transposon TNT 1-94 n=1 Tax=Cajanus cajan TaxID=3821 RepID=A0A151T0B1_CAJCA|nr:Retrovirus-related Pol polyprotein from transposon TNT 1-94 [Cajanus cajan]
MRFPPGFSIGSPGSACKLQRSLYGLKQALRNWFAKLRNSLLNFGFQQSKADYTLFTFTRDQDFVAVLIYVDDILLAGNNNLLVIKLRFILALVSKSRILANLNIFSVLNFLVAPLVYF